MSSAKNSRDDKIPPINVMRHEYMDGFRAGQKAAELNLTPRSETAVNQFLSPLASEAAWTGFMRNPPLTPQEAEAALKMEAELNKVPENERRRAIHKLMRKHKRDLERLAADKADAKRKHERLVAEGKVFDEIVEWSKGNLVLERPSEPSFWDLRQQVKSRTAFHCMIPPDPTGDTLDDYEVEIFRKAQVFMVEHDWAAAFSRADIGSDFKLPYDVCAFDLQVSGRSIICMAVQDVVDILLSIAVKSPLGWLVLGFAWSLRESTWKDDNASNSTDDNLSRLFRLAGRQVAAISVALDAEVAKTDVVREKHQGTIGKNFHMPLRSYHVVSLARRPYAAARLEPAEPIGRHVRLHFRRGHWRHFPAFKTWIKWTLVGDPDLGFVDKHYRL